jgi:hypothetical protein
MAECLQAQVPEFKTYCHQKKKKKKIQKQKFPKFRKRFKKNTPISTSANSSALPDIHLQM